MNDQRHPAGTPESRGGQFAAQQKSASTSDFPEGAGDETTGPACPHCNGHGVRPSGRQCIFCDGTGIDEDPLTDEDRKRVAYGAAKHQADGFLGDVDTEVSYFETPAEALRHLDLDGHYPGAPVGTLRAVEARITILHTIEHLKMDEYLTWDDGRDRYEAWRERQGPAFYDLPDTEMFKTFRMRWYESERRQLAKQITDLEFLKRFAKRSAA